MTDKTTQTAIRSIIAAAEGLIAKAGELRLIGASKTQYAILRIGKIHSLEKLRLALEHDLREAHAANADPAGEIEVIAGARTVARALQRYDDVMERANDGTPVIVVKNGKRPVIALELVMDGPSNEVWSSWPAETQTAWKEAQIEWFKRYFPSNSILTSVIHKDESRVHNTLVAVPLALRPSPQALRYAKLRGGDGSDLPKHWMLSAKEFVGQHRFDFRERQTEYAHAMAPFGLKRGQFVEETKAVNVPNKVYRMRAAELVSGMERVLTGMHDVLVEHQNLNDALARHKAETEALKEQMSVALRSEREAIEQMWADARRQIAAETAVAKAESKRRAETAAQDRVRIEADRAAIATECAALAADRAALCEDRDALETLKMGLAAQAAEIAKEKAAGDRRVRDLADQAQTLTAERGRLGLLAERLENAQRDLTSAQMRLTADLKAAEAKLAMASDLDQRAAYLASKEAEVKARIESFNAKWRALKRQGEVLAAEQAKISELQAAAEAAKAAAEAAMAAANTRAAEADHLVRQARSDSERARSKEKALDVAIARVPAVHQQVVRQMATRQAGQAL